MCTMSIEPVSSLLSVSFLFVLRSRAPLYYHSHRPKEKKAFTGFPPTFLWFPRFPLPAFWPATFLQYTVSLELQQHPCSVFKPFSSLSTQLRRRPLLVCLIIPVILPVSSAAFLLLSYSPLSVSLLSVFLSLSLVVSLSVSGLSIALGQTPVITFG